MKKILSLFLAFSMLVTSLGTVALASEEDPSILDSVLTAIDFSSLILPSDESQFNNFEYAKSTEDGYVIYSGTLSGGNSETGYTDLEALMLDGVINDANLFGFTIGDLYSSDRLNWNKISQIATNEETQEEYELNSYNTFSLAKAYTNRYLLQKFVEKFGEAGSLELYTLDNLLTITNFIGRVVNPNFKELTAEKVNVAYTSEKDFYTSIVTLSGLRDIIANYWCNDYNLNFKALLSAVGFDFDDEEMLGDSKIYNADRVSRTLVRSIIKRMIQQGPLEYLLSTLGNISVFYRATYEKSIKALFTPQLNAGNVTKTQLESIEGIVNLIVNGNNPKDASKLQLLYLPIDKINTTSDGATTDTTRLFMITLLYLNTVSKWKTNERVYTYYDYTEQALKTEKITVDNRKVAENILNTTEDAGLKSIIKAFFFADFTDYLALLTVESDKHMEDIKHPGDNIVGGLKEYFASILKFFADIIAKIYNSFKNFGDF